MKKTESEFVKFTKHKNVVKAFYFVVVLSALTALWWIVAVTAFQNNPIVPAPPEVIGSLSFSAKSGKLWIAIWNTFFKSLLGFIASFCFGVLLAVLAHRHRSVKYCVGPVVTVIRAFPTLAITYLLLMYLRTEQTAVVVGALMIFPILYSGLYTALGGVDKNLLAMADVYGVSRLSKFTGVYLPGIAPQLFTSAIGAFALNMKVVIAAEIVGGIAPNTIGNFMAAARESYDYASMFAWVLTAIMFAFLIEAILRFIMRMCLPWKYRTRKRVLFFFRKLFRISPKEYTVMMRPDSSSDGMVPATVALNGVDFSYETHSILKGFSAVFEAGKIHCIMGPSGVGKTTLLNLSAGILSPQNGAVNGTERISHLFQEPRLIQEKTVLQNLIFALTPQFTHPKQSRKQKKQVVKDRALHYLTAVGLGKALDLLPRELSGGMAQRAALARAFAVPGELLLMDEPFKGLDIKLKQSVSKLFLELLEKENRTVLFVTHDYDEALLIADCIHIFESELPVSRLPQFPIETPRRLRSLLDTELLALKEKILAYSK